MQPETGGRFSLRLREHDPAGATFELTLATAEATLTARARVAAADGAVDVSGWSGPSEPPAWLLHYARAALRSAWQAHREQGWPRRLTRWRDVPARSAEGRGEPEP